MGFMEASVFAFSEQELYLDRKYGDVWTGMFSSYELAQLSSYRYIYKYDIRNIAIVQVGKFGGQITQHQQMDIWRRITERHGCVQSKYIDPTNMQDIESYIDYIRHDKSLQMIVVFTKYANIKNIIELTGNITDKIWFWYPEKLLPRLDYNIDPQALATHNLIVEAAYVLEEASMLTYEEMHRRMCKKCFENIVNDKLIRNYLYIKGLNSSSVHVFKPFDGKRTINDIYVELLVASIWKTYNEFVRDFDKFNEFDLRQFRIRLMLSREIHFLRKDVNSNTSFFSSEFHHNLSHLNRKSNCNAISCWTGYEPEYKPFYDNNTGVERHNWRCMKCDINFIKPGYGPESCKKCHIDRRSNINRTHCDDPYTNIYLKATDVVIVIQLLISFLGIMFNIVTIAIVLKFRRTPVIRASSLYPSMLQLLSHSCLFISSPFLFLYKPNQLKCCVQPVLIGALLTIISTITMTKTIKSQHAFKSSLVVSKRAVVITKSAEWFSLLLTILIQGLNGGISFYQVLPTIDHSLNREKLTRNVFCKNQRHFYLQLSFVLILSLSCLMQAFRGRNLPGYFNESMRTTYSMLITIVILVITFPISISQSDMQDSSLVILLSVTLINLIQLLIMYAYKVYIVLFRAERNTRASFQLAMMKHSEKTVTRKMRSSSNKN